MDKIDCRAAFISDVHLGTRGSSAEQLSEIIKNLECEIIYLVGDIVDIINLKYKPKNWTKEHTKLIKLLLKKAQRGTKIYYLPGNHDAAVRAVEDLEIGENIVITDEVIHTTKGNKQYIVVHGDVFDLIIQKMTRLAIFGGILYDLLVFTNREYNKWRSKRGLAPYSLSKKIKENVKNAVKVISKFENAAVEYARKRKLEGIICGHIHTPTSKIIDGIEYWNCGDWVESLSLVVEKRNGLLDHIYYNQWSIKDEPGS